MKIHYSKVAIGKFFFNLAADFVKREEGGVVFPSSKTVFQCSIVFHGYNLEICLPEEKLELLLVTLMVIDTL
jgi:hypothetical protein